MSTSSDDNLNAQALGKLKARLRDLNIIDYDPTRYSAKESFRKLFELRQLTTAFEEYLQATNAISLITDLRSNWELAIAVKYPLASPFYGSLLNDTTATRYEERLRDLNARMTADGYQDPITGEMGLHPQAAITTQARTALLSEIQSHQSQLSQHHTAFDRWQKDVKRVETISSKTDRAVGVFLDLFCVAIRDICNPQSAVTTTAQLREDLLLSMNYFGQLIRITFL